MTAAKSSKKVRLPKPLHIVQLHLKVVAAFALGAAVYVVLTLLSEHMPILLGKPPRISSRTLIAWNVGVLFYLALATWVIVRAELKHLCDRAAEEDEGAALILVFTVLAAAASVVAIFFELEAARGNKANWLSPILAVSTVILSWFFIQTIFAFHYAHEFHGEAEGGRKGGLKFPETDAGKEETPDYWDFVYFSFVIGMTFQVSDVQVTSKAVRRLVVAHGIVSFFYNVAVLALIVNMGGELIKG
jgi:uncharacterized membrane protein